MLFVDHCKIYGYVEGNGDDELQNGFKNFRNRNEFVCNCRYFMSLIAQTSTKKSEDVRGRKLD